MNRRTVTVVVVVVVAMAMCASCKRNEGGITAVPGGFPSTSSTTPAEVSNSGQVIAITAASTDVSRGGSTDAVVKLSISSGYHINANPATFAYLIATEVTPGKVEGIITEKPKYPAARKQKFEFAEEPLAVYEGDVDIKLPVKAGAKAGPGDRSLPITVRVQACDTEKCFPPATLNAKIPVIIK